MQSRYLPRLFTGAMLPEELCSALRTAVKRSGDGSATYSLADSLWVPTSVLDSQCFGQRVTIRSGVRPVHIATQCPAALQLFARHCGSVGGSLVSASQTTSPATLVAFFQSLQPTCGPDPLVGVAESSAGVQLATADEPLPYLPLTLSSGFFPNQVAKALTEYAGAHALRSPYWLPGELTAIRRPLFRLREPTAGVTVCGKRYVNAEHTMCPGFFVPDNLAGAYEPYSIYGTMFSKKDERLMHQRALQHRFSRALWLTEDEAKRFGCFLRDDSQRDEGPLRLCVPFQGARRLLYCADQFDRPELLPTRREIRAFACGVAEPASKRNAYPALCEAHRSAHGREEFLDYYANHFSPIVSSKTETRRNRFVYLSYLREFSALAGIRDEVFLTSNNLYRFPEVFRVRDGAVCCAKHGGLQNSKDVTLFSASDIEPRGVAVQLATNAPTSVDSLRRYFGTDAIAMCRYQAEKQVLADASAGGTMPSSSSSQESVNRWWISSSLLDALGLLSLVDLSKTFHMVRQVAPLTWTGSKSLQASRRTLREPPACSDDPAFHAADANQPTQTRIYIHVSDVPDPDGRLSGLMNYFPVNWVGVQFTGSHRSAMLQAAARDRSLLRDPRWLSLRFLTQHDIFLASCSVPASAITVTGDEHWSESEYDPSATSDDGCSGSDLAEVVDGAARDGGDNPTSFHDAAGAAVGAQFSLMSMRLVPVASLSDEQRVLVDAALEEARRNVEIRTCKNEFSFDTRGTLRKSFRQGGSHPLARKWTPEATEKMERLHAVPTESTTW